VKLEKYRHPVLFYLVAVLVPWALWFIWGALSHSALYDKPGWMIFGSILGLAGLMAPMACALALILPDREMRDELVSACVNFKGIHAGWYILTFALPLGSVLLAQAVSLLFGYSAGQFRLAGNFSFNAGIFPTWFVMILAPVIEEFGWHTYGVHCVRRRFSLFASCFVFGVIWGAWHMPLSTVKGYYQAVLVEMGPLHSINFLVSLIPYLIIDNWMYYKTKRNMFLEVAFHWAMGYSMEIFQTHPDTKIIHTILLAVFSAVIVIRERKFFFDKTFDRESDPWEYTEE
jgi:membrane protease YdiL (CAAX protease family)